MCNLIKHVGGGGGNLGTPPPRVALAQGDTGATRPKPYFGRRPSTPCPRRHRRKPPTRSSHGRRRRQGVSSWFPGSLAARLCGTGVFAVAAVSSSRRAPVGSAGGLALLAAAGLGEWWRLVLVVLRRFRSVPGPIWAQKGRPLLLPQPLAAGSATRQPRGGGHGARRRVLHGCSPEPWWF